MTPDLYIFRNKLNHDHPTSGSEDILLFPPYLMHFVPEQKDIDSDDKMRVTFSFNLLNTFLLDANIPFE